MKNAAVAVASADAESNAVEKKTSLDFGDDSLANSSEMNRFNVEKVRKDDES